MGFEFGPRRGKYFDITEEIKKSGKPLSAEELGHFEALDLIYRSLCAMLYNYVPMSGHPGGSISSGRFVAGILFGAMDYDVGNPDREDADMISYAAGHKALGLYAMWALRNEIMRAGAPDLLPDSERLQLRLEDLLGFRRNPVTKTPLFERLQSKPLDGHPTPATPFVKLSTGASGVGVPTSLGLAWGAKDYYGGDAPRVHIVEGEGGMTPGRVGEALAAAGTASLGNAIVHLDWNQASIDSNHVCRDGDTPGDYVQWNPMEFFHLHDWNVVYAPDGKDFQQVVAAQKLALSLDNGQPTAIVYRTIKGWLYGMEGRVSHGGGHKLCSDEFSTALEPLLGTKPSSMPCCEDLNNKRCDCAEGSALVEECFWQALGVMRGEIERRSDTVQFLARRLQQARQRLDQRGRKARQGAPRIEAVYAAAKGQAATVPAELALTAGTKTTLRGELGRVLSYYNKASDGSILVAAADLVGSTSINKITDGFPQGYFNAVTNSESRLMSIGGICEDAMCAVAAGLGTYGRHFGLASSYGAFIAPLGHIASRLHCIGQQARQVIAKEPYRPMFLVCAHAGLKTGEDGPTHADPQALQLLQENFPAGTAVTLTPWDPAEMWPLVTAALEMRPAVIAPFVTRPAETVPDRPSLGLAPATDAKQGVYLLRAARAGGDGTVVLQGSGVTMAFVGEVLPRLMKEGIDLNVYYVASAELFDALPAAERERIFPEEHAREAMGITGLTLPTMYRWIRSDSGRARTLHPFGKGHFLGSGQAHMVLAEAGLDGQGQYEGIMQYLNQQVKA